MGNTVGSQRKLTRRQKAILIGTLLGDCCMEKRWKNARLRVDHGLKQKSYLEWKFREFQNLATDKPRIVKSFHYTAKKNYPRWHFSTFAIPELNEYWQSFYYQKRKRIPENISEIFKSPLSLAVWYMDDGYKRNDCNALRINTDCFNYQEQELLVRCLKTNFGVNAKIHRKGKFWNIYVPNPEAENFCKILKPYTIPKMKYKISLTP